MTIADSSLPTAAGSSATPTLAVIPVWRRFINFPNLLTLAFLAVCGTLIFRHALWRDEAQAFLIARDSLTLGDLFHNLRYEGHPPLWHILLWIVTRFTDRIEGMQTLHLLMAAGSVYLVARFSPFPWLARLLFAFGYFPLFEYGVISRNYQLIMLLALAFCAFWQRHRTAYVRLSLLLGLLCLSHAYGLIIATGLGFALLLDALLTRPGRAAIAKKPFHFLLAMAIALGTIAATVWLLKPPPDSGYLTGWVFRFDPGRWSQALGTLWDGLAYVPVRRPYFWKSSAFSGADAELGILVALGALLMLIHSWRASSVFVISVAGLFAFFYVKHMPSSVRHHGTYFIALLAACWIAWGIHGAGFDPARHPLWRRIVAWIPRTALTALLMLHVYSGAVAVYYAWRIPFSASRATGLFIRRESPLDEPIFCDSDVYGTGPAAYLPGRQFYYPHGRRMGSFTIWDRGVFGGNGGGMQAAQNYANAQRRSIIYIADYDESTPFPTAKKLGEFDGGLATDESYVVYRITPRVSLFSGPPRTSPAP